MQVYKIALWELLSMHKCVVQTVERERTGMETCFTVTVSGERNAKEYEIFIRYEWQYCGLVCNYWQQVNYWMSFFLVGQCMMC